MHIFEFRQRLAQAAAHPLWQWLRLAAADSAAQLLQQLLHVRRGAARGAGPPGATHCASGILSLVGASAEEERGKPYSLVVIAVCALRVQLLQCEFEGAPPATKWLRLAACVEPRSSITSSSSCCSRSMMVDVAILCILLAAVAQATWMVVDGSRALLLGDYFTPSGTGRLGPWTYVVRAVGIAPRSTLMKLLFVGQVGRRCRCGRKCSNRGGCRAASGSWCVGASLQTRLGLRARCGGVLLPVSGSFPSAHC